MRKNNTKYLTFYRITLSHTHACSELCVQEVHSSIFLNILNRNNIVTWLKYRDNNSLSIHLSTVIAIECKTMAICR